MGWILKFRHFALDPPHLCGRHIVHAKVAKWGERGDLNLIEVVIKRQVRGLCERSMVNEVVRVVRPCLGFDLMGKRWWVQVQVRSGGERG